jgi:hypothetical protein
VKNNMETCGLSPCFPCFPMFSVFSEWVWFVGYDTHGNGMVMSRIALLIYVGVVGWFGFMLTEFYRIGHIPDLLSVVIFALAGLVLVLTIIVPMIIGVRRQERMIAKGTLLPGAVVSVPSRVKLYVLIVTITLISVTIQILKLFPEADNSIHRHSPVIIWNVAAMVAVIVLIEILYRLKKTDGQR